MKTIFIFLLLLPASLGQVAAQEAITPDTEPQYAMYMACVKPLVRLTEKRWTYPGHIFWGYCIKSRQGLDSVIQFCGNQPEVPLIKNVFTRRKGLPCGTLAGYMSLDESVYVKYPQVYQLEISVTKAQYEQAIAIRDKWVERKLFKVNGMDCVSFVEEVATQALGFRPTHRNYLHNLIPIRYWKHQIKHNKDRIKCYGVHYCRVVK